MAVCIKDRQQNEAQGTGDAEEDGHNGTGLVEETLIRCQLTSMSQPSFAEKGQSEKDTGDCTTSDEERL